ncbi:hypothetical protein [Nitrososphaera sp.]|uniref:hypothetical protein n=1 Tax=Nitrososphaera sp. TaxID=1971748 RepID=UPI00307F4DA2
MAKAFPVQYDRERARKAFDILLSTREPELKQLALDIGYPTTGADWQEKVLLFCLDVNSCFIDLSKDKMDEVEIHKCMTLMKTMAKDRPLIESQKIQDLAYNIAEDFKSLYMRQD